jgi:hypothetical protein
MSESNTSFSQRLQSAFERGRHERSESKRRITEAISQWRAAIDSSDLGLHTEGSEFDGIFIQLNTTGNTTGSTTGSKDRGWWAYMIVQTEPTGLEYLLNAGFGQKNNPESLHDCMPEVTVRSLDDALARFEEYIEAGVYYFGLLRR